MTPKSSIISIVSTPMSKRADAHAKILYRPLRTLEAVESICTVTMKSMLCHVTFTDRTLY